jgi:hypothetical protein
LQPKILTRSCNLGRKRTGADVQPEGKVRIVGKISGVGYKAKVKRWDFGEAISNTPNTPPRLSQKEEK